MIDKDVTFVNMLASDTAAKTVLPISGVVKCDEKSSDTNVPANCKKKAAMTGNDCDSRTTRRCNPVVVSSITGSSSSSFPWLSLSSPGADGSAPLASAAEDDDDDVAFSLATTCQIRSPSSPFRAAPPALPASSLSSSSSSSPTMVYLPFNGFPTAAAAAVAAEVAAVAAAFDALAVVMLSSSVACSVSVTGSCSAPLLRDIVPCNRAFLLCPCRSFFFRPSATTERRADVRVGSFSYVGIVKCFTGL